jgi:hypothetical protein
MAFGNRQFAMNIAAPIKGLVAPMKAPVGQRVLNNGQMSLTRTPNYRKEFDFIFKGTEEELMTIKDFAEGRYGQGPWLFNNPRAMNGNMLPRTWSQPANAVGNRGNQALDLYTGATSFSGTVKQNPHVAPAAVTGLAGAPVTGAKLWSPSPTPQPVVPATTGSRPVQSFLVPPGFAARLTVWGVQNTANSPDLMYAISNVGPSNTTIPTGTPMSPVLAGVTVTFPQDTVTWRVLDIWIAAGVSGPANTDWTIFSAIDLRITPKIVTAQPTVFSYGRGQFPVDFSEDTQNSTLAYVGSIDKRTFYETDLTMTEVTQPW